MTAELGKRGVKLGDELVTINTGAEIGSAEMEFTISKGKHIDENALWQYIAARRSADEKLGIRIGIRKIDAQSQKISYVIEGDYNQIVPNDPEGRTVLARFEAALSSFER